MLNLNVTLLNADLNMNDAMVLALDLNMDNLDDNMDLYTDSLLIGRMPNCPQGRRLVT